MKKSHRAKGSKKSFAENAGISSDQDIDRRALARGFQWKCGLRACIFNVKRTGKMEKMYQNYYPYIVEKERIVRIRKLCGREKRKKRSRGAYRTDPPYVLCSVEDQMSVLTVKEGKPKKK